MAFGNRNKATAAASAALLKDSTLSQLDVASYDLDALRNALTDVVDVRSAISGVLRWMGIGAVVGTLLAWLIVGRGLGGFGLFVFVVAMALASALAGAAIGVVAIARKRVAGTHAAADQALQLTEIVHRDYVKVTEHGVELPVREVGTLVAREVVFPVLLRSASRAVSVAGPVGYVLSYVIDIPLNAVERRVLGALDALPSGPSPASSVQDSVTDTAEVVSGPHDDLGTHYAGLAERLSAVVTPIGALVTTSTLVFAALCAVPWIAVVIITALVR